MTHIPVPNAISYMICKHGIISSVHLDVAADYLTCTLITTNSRDHNLLRYLSCYYKFRELPSPTIQACKRSRLS